MALTPSPFPNRAAAGLHAAGWALVWPCFWSLDRVIAVCKSTTLERRQRREQECYLRPLKVFFGVLLFFLLFLLSLPFGFLGFLLWAPLQVCRRPFRYLVEESLPDRETHRGFESEGKASFCFATANLCLLPDGLARFNNLGDSQSRAARIGRLIFQGVGRPNLRVFVQSPGSCGALSPSDSILPEASSTSYGATRSQPAARRHPEPGSAALVESNSHVVCVPCDDSDDSSRSNQEKRGGAPRAPPSQGLADVPWEVSTMFPANLDVLCLEEVFDTRAAKKLTDRLKPVFGHILYDVGVYACQPPCSCSTFKFFNSGMLLASRFPVLEAQYHFFPNSRGEDALAAKGLLSAKLLIGRNRKGKDVVGYFNCTHLHAPEGEGEIRCLQLNMVTKWIGDFQAANKLPDEDVVFDVLCGDFNFDNCSPDDHLEQNHALFEEYRDPCRAGPGREKPWVIGTLLRQPTLYDDDVNTAENLQRTLVQEELRKRYISPPVPAEGRPLLYPEDGQPWVGRRLDYILFRENSISDRCRTEVEEVSFITQLAALTDHIPVGLRIKVSMA
ncbi:sphingomyelin phosphodiesterase 5 isoform X2 [Synchiropus splendidus]|uniref:sphingomyelin phosphodiesterase 5 isoform X2 n=1 Tax=Synchiropus splendidus TaxID=270530 RepID=UPI00237DEC10|nr:sphingomyelin phosphodiesterase 5 isoform X2 [Synchiropus splendidus]